MMRTVLTTRELDLAAQMHALLSGYTFDEIQHALSRVSGKIEYEIQQLMVSSSYCPQPEHDT